MNVFLILLMSQLGFAQVPLKPSQIQKNRQPAQVVAQRKPTQTAPKAVPPKGKSLMDATSKKSFNIQVSPFVALSMMNFELAYVVNSNLVGSFDYFSSTSKASSGGQADVSANYTSMSLAAKYFFRPYGDSSWFVGAGAGSYNYNISGSASFAGATLTVSGTAKTVGTTISDSGSGTLFFGGGGYQWFWESFNQQLGIYYVSRAYTGYSIKISNNGSAGNIFPPVALDYKLGWAF